MIYTIIESKLDRFQLIKILFRGRIKSRTLTVISLPLDSLIPTSVSFGAK